MGITGDTYRMRGGRKGDAMSPEAGEEGWGDIASPEAGKGTRKANYITKMLKYARKGLFAGL